MCRSSNEIPSLQATLSRAPRQLQGGVFSAGDLSPRFCSDGAPIWQRQKHGTARCASVSRRHTGDHHRALGTPSRAPRPLCRQLQGYLADKKTPVLVGFVFL